MGFDHRRLDVYGVAIELLGVTEAIAAPLARQRPDLANQLRRAASSIPLNVGEGSGEFSPGEKRRFYRIARRSAIECVAILDVLRALGLANKKKLDEAEGLLDRITAMLTVMTKEPRKKPPGS